MNQREIAKNIIFRTISDNAFTNLLLRKDLNKIEPIQRAFISNLVYGVLKNYDLLLFQTKNLYKKTSISNKIVLAMATYEYLFLKKEKYIIINEYVSLVANKYDKGFINAILHNLKDNISYDLEHINYSIPEWIYNLLSKQYQKDELELILNNYLRIPKTYYHLNQNKCNYKDLNKYNIDIITEKCFTSDSNLLNTKEFHDGYFYVQDVNAEKLINKLDLKKDDTFLDGCSAPGSKLFNALEYIDENNAYANDINVKRVNLIKNRAKELGYTNIHFYNLDAREIEKINIKFDKILIDVPCSGLGVIGRRPDIKFHISSNSLDELENIQKDILISASKLLKDKGILMYSTCTLNKKENTKQINNFLNNNKTFELVEENTILTLDGDLFYYAIIKKV